MNIELFLIMFAVLTVISGLVTEAIKKLFEDKEHFSTNLLAMVDAIVIGIVGVLAWCHFTGLAITTDSIIYAILLGLSCGVASMVGFDKVKQAILQIKGGK